MALLAICKEKVAKENKMVILGKKGSDSVNKASKDRGDIISVALDEAVHTTCHKNFWCVITVKKPGDQKRSKTPFGPVCGLAWKDRSISRVIACFVVKRLTR